MNWGDLKRSFAHLPDDASIVFAAQYDDGELRLVDVDQAHVCTQETAVNVEPRNVVTDTEAQKDPGTQYVPLSDPVGRLGTFDY